MISTITVNYKTADYLERMLESLFQFHTEGNIEVIVVENGSGDNLSHIMNRFPMVKYLFSETNLGFAGGCNLGLTSATGEYLVLLNPDIVFTEPALYEICQMMDAQTDVGIGGISLKNLDGTQQKCVWKFPTPLDQFILLLKIPHLFPNIAPISQWRMDGFDYMKDADVDQVMGAFFCIRRDVINEIGLLDDGFFIWYEEVDYCRRVVNAGWRVRYFAYISTKHKKGSSFDRVPTVEKQKILRKSIRRYMKKHFGFFFGMLFTVCEPLFQSLSLLAALIKPL